MICIILLEAHIASLSGITCNISGIICLYKDRWIILQNMSSQYPTVPPPLPTPKPKRQTPINDTYNIYEAVYWRPPWTSSPPQNDPHPHHCRRRFSFRLSEIALALFLLILVIYVGKYQNNDILIDTRTNVRDIGELGVEYFLVGTRNGRNNIRHQTQIFYCEADNRDLTQADLRQKLVIAF